MRALLLVLLCFLAGPVLPAPATAPMLATSYRHGVAVPEFLVSEKLDGVRGRWDGQRLWTRGGAPVTPPPGFTRGWPGEPMEGELWLGRGRFDEVSALVRRLDADPRAWRGVRFMVFDLPAHPGPFTGRVVRISEMLGRKNIRSEEPTEKVDTKVLETLVELDPGQRLPIGLRVDTYILRGSRDSGRQV